MLNIEEDHGVQYKITSCKGAMDIIFISFIVHVNVVQGVCVCVYVCV